MTEQVREQKGAVQAIARRWRSVAVAALVAVAGTLAVAALHRPAATDSRFSVSEQDAVSAAASPDPLMAELVRCRTLQPQAADPRCSAAWEENRRRFFGEHRAMRVPGDPMPAYAPIPTDRPAER